MYADWADDSKEAMDPAQERGALLADIAAGGGAAVWEEAATQPHLARARHVAPPCP